MRDAPQHKLTVKIVQRIEVPYMGVPARDVNEIFKVALNLRFTKPDALIIIEERAPKLRPRLLPQY